MACGCPAHHAKGLFGRRVFKNLWPTWEERSLSDIYRWMKEKKTKGMPGQGWLTGNHFPTDADFAAAFPLVPPDWQRLANPPSHAVQATWLGHASTLVQMHGQCFLTDPIQSLRCSPVQWAGPKRVVPPPLDLLDARMPRIDFVVISHSHYDHLDAGTVRQLRDAHGDAVRWYVPLGLRAWMAGAGVRNCVELDWWEEAVHPARAGSGGEDVRVACTPCQHWSQRTPWDRCTTLWASWAVLGPKLRFWFGYCTVFEEIGKRLGPFDLSAIPVAAYEPRWFHRPAHVDPAEAVKIHKDVRSKRSLAVHCCTWSLTDEALDEPPRLLAAEAAAAGLAPDEFTALQHGAMMLSPGAGATAA